MDYRNEGPDRYKTMTLEPGEFIRRFLMHRSKVESYSVHFVGTREQGPRASAILG
jgi:hypothetical protein